MPTVYPFTRQRGCCILPIGTMHTTYHDVGGPSQARPAAAPPSARQGCPVPTAPPPQLSAPLAAPMSRPSPAPRVPAWSAQRPWEGTPRSGYLVRVAQGLLWRFALVGVVTLGPLISPAIPLAAAMGVLIACQAVSLRRSPGAATPLWRTGLITLTLAVASNVQLSSTAVAGGLLWLGLEPWVLAGRPWRPRVDRLCARILEPLGERDGSGLGATPSRLTDGGRDTWR